MSRWRYPTLTVHEIDVPIDNSTVISHYVTAGASIRIVPNQVIEGICENFKQNLYQVFQKQKSENQMSTSRNHIQFTLYLSNIVLLRLKFKVLPLTGLVTLKVSTLKQQNWRLKKNGRSNHCILEKGESIPAVRWLEKFCKASAIHIPFDQSSDQAHVSNERIKLSNLHAG